MSKFLKCCSCKGSSAEIEIVDSGSLDNSVQEEGSWDNGLDLQTVKLELLCMKTVIDKYQKKLRGYFGICPDDPCIDYDTELKCSKNEEICELQRSQYKLQCQINELVLCCKTAKCELRNLRSLVCKKSEEILKLQKRVAALESWRRTLELEAGLCIERFEFLKSVKAEWSDVVEKLESDKKCFAQLEKKLVPRICYKRDKKYFITEITNLKQMFTELFELQNTKFNFTNCQDSPLRSSEWKLAEIEYMKLKQKLNDEEYEKDKNSQKCD